MSEHRKFEKWASAYSYGELPLDRDEYTGLYNDKEVRALWACWQAAQQAAEPKWIPYKPGDEVEEGWYLVTIFYALTDSAVVVVDHRCKGCWDIETYDYTVTAYRQLPTPFGGDA